MKRIAFIAIYALAWVAWLQWGLGFIQISRALGGSYWVGLPDAEASTLAWVLWPPLVLLVYVLPIALLVLLPVVLGMRARRPRLKVENAQD